MNRAARVLGAIALVGLVACASAKDDGASAPSGPPEDDQATAVATDWLVAARERMVKQQIEGRGISDPAVLAAMRAVPRHEFIPGTGREHAYEDHPVPIGHQQTVAQPYIVAQFAELAGLGPKSKVLEIGTGSGYQAAVLAAIAERVFTIEIIEPLAKSARETLARVGADNVAVKLGDGYQGWPEQAPFDAIVVTAAPPRIPEPLLDQLKVGGKMVIPVGESHQELRVITRTDSGFDERTVFPVRFLPMTGRAQEGKQATP